MNRNRQIMRCPPLSPANQIKDLSNRQSSNNSALSQSPQVQVTKEFILSPFPTPSPVYIRPFGDGLSCTDNNTAMRKTKVPFSTEENKSIARIRLRGDHVLKRENSRLKVNPNQTKVMLTTMGKWLEKNRTLYHIPLNVIRTDIPSLILDKSRSISSGPFIHHPCRAS